MNKSIQYLIVFGSIISIALLASCEPNCNQKVVTRPNLTEDYLQWVKVVDTAPKFKVTTYENGVAHIDTVKGHYTYTLENKQLPSGESDCTSINFQEAKNVLSLKSGQYDFGIGIGMTINNYSSQDGYKGELYQEFFDQHTILDTARINGKLYTDVFKIEPPKTASSIIYYSKSIGIIYLNYHNTIELLP